jgi:DNA transformation protein
MANSRAFMDYVNEMLAALGAVHARAMFGGHGLYLDDVMFAIVVDDTLYLKCDAGNHEALRQAGARPFRYRRGAREIEMGFLSAPDEALDDADTLCGWAQGALGAARRAAAKHR